MRLAEAKGHRIAWSVWFALLVLLSYVLPYTILADVTKIYGAYLFWVIITLIIIVSVIALTLRWRE